MFEQLGLIGCGLMGSSFALALRQAGLVKRVVGYSKSPSTTEQARQLGIIDVEAPSALLAASGADIVLLAVPVAAIGPTLKAIRHVVTSEMLVMDVGSTKADVVEAAREALRERIGSFVPAHPIAGAESSGPAKARADLYRDRQVVLTPIERTLTIRLQQAEAVWKALGCSVRQMSPDTHDAALAAISHLPHMLAFAAVNALDGQPQGSEFLGLAGPGFRDYSRIAAASPEMWRDILLANRAELRRQADAFRLALNALEDAMERGDAQQLEALIARASRVRSAWRMHTAGAAL
ncbi:prephenate dehydrogenase/arogenate dehydrogenase family protein [Xylophilus rhododendri]|uniref:Prephenate dehydrogenase/arogenate dehydrogenase family protein n=1 Tax=Xylophilus rhododendri TaxID=2697032 RepID=A0A857JEL0_9BURK|nr:prephenate dehydrogenase/arogenate dehydrogenase family protein [Xylophilus rhododendri]QHJ01632.1 prephenate dehydrogenase/arogenate dehydrogenase family protein [Xylophilus rhododendri]